MVDEDTTERDTKKKERGVNISLYIIIILVGVYPLVLHAAIQPVFKKKIGSAPTSCNNLQLMRTIFRNWVCN